jgi:hypothetical protein
MLEDSAYLIGTPFRLDERVAAHLHLQRVVAEAADLDRGCTADYLSPSSSCKKTYDG